MQQILRIHSCMLGAVVIASFVSQGVFAQTGGCPSAILTTGNQTVTCSTSATSIAPVSSAIAIQTYASSPAGNQPPSGSPPLNSTAYDAVNATVTQYTTIQLSGSPIGLASGSSATNYGTLSSNSFLNGYGISFGVNGRTNTGGNTALNAATGRIITGGGNANGIYIATTSAGARGNTITNDGSITTNNTSTGSAAAISLKSGATGSAIVNTIINTGTLTTLGAGSYGIEFTSVSGVNTVNNSGSITTSGSAAHGVSIASTRNTVAITNSGTISTLGAGANGIDVSGAANITNSGTISSASGLAINLGGTLPTNAFNSLTINNGSVINGGIAFNSASTRETLTFNGYTNSGFNNAITGLNIINASNSSNVVMSSLAGYDLVSGQVAVDASSAFSISGVVRDQVSPAVASTITKTGAGALTLSGGNTYTGGTNLSAGTIAVGNNTALGTGNLAMADGTTLQAASSVGLANAVNVAGAATIDTNGSSLGLSGNIAGAGSLTKIGVGTLTLSGVNAYSGGTTISAGALVGNTTSLQGNIANNATVEFNQTAVGTYAGVMSGTGSLVKEGASTLTLSGANTYTGGTNLNAGTIAVGNNTVLGTGSLAMATGTTLQAASSVSLGNTVDVAGVANMDTNGNNLGLSGVISGVGAVTKMGAGTLTLTGANTYAGGTTVSVGTLAVGNNAALGTGSLAMANNTTLQAASSVSLSNNIGATGAANIDTNGNSLVLSGAISGASDVNKYGAGTLTLSGINTYSGETNINAGSVILTGSTSSNTNIAAGAILQGNGTINGNVNNAGSIIPSFTGTQTNLTINGNYVGAGGNFVSNVYAPVTNPVADKLLVSGAVSGATGVTIIDKGGLGNRTSGSGIEVIQVGSGGSSTANAFTLNQRVASGAFEYKLVKGDATGAGNSWYLRTDNPASPAAPTSAVIPEALATPAVGERIEVSVYPALPSLMQLYAQTAVDTLDQRRGDLNLVDPQGSTKKTADGWARIIGKTGASTPSNVSDGPKLNFNTYALQFGTDLYKDESGSRTYVGPYVTIGGANGNTSNQAGTISTGSINGMQAYSFGLYATHFAQNGLYVDALAQGSKYLNANASSVQGAQLKTQGSGLTGSLEAGGRWNVTEKSLISPQAQVVYDAIGMNNASDAYGQINFTKSEMSRGRLGLLFGQKDIVSGTPIFAYIRASYWNVFNPGTTTSFQSLYGVNSVSFQSQTASSWMTVDAEINARLTKDTNLFLNLAVDNSLVGTYQAYSGRLGLQTRF